ncbi:MAG TPA: RluA family pseudouridine synthase [Terriglobales bacterium]
MAENTTIRTLVVLPQAAGKRLDQWLASELAEVSRVRVQQLIEQHKVSVNGGAAKPSLRLRGGENIVISGQVELPPLRAFAEDIALDIVYEDNDVAVINKPAGMVVHAGSGKNEAESRGTLVNALLHRLGPLSQVGGDLRPGIVHRLDKQTSGLLVVAKNDVAHRKLARQFAARQVKKTYLALVHGEMKKPRGTIDLPIGRDPVRRARMTTRATAGGRPGRSAVTHWTVLRKIAGKFGKFSLLEIKIETGRTHQIRVHLASIGHPIVGDTVYGAPKNISCYSSPASKPASLERNFLHASAIEFRHPTSNAPLSFQQPKPQELESFFLRIAE